MSPEIAIKMSFGLQASEGSAGRGGTASGEGPFPQLWLEPSILFQLSARAQFLIKHTSLSTGPLERPHRTAASSPNSSDPGARQGGSHTPFVTWSQKCNTLLSYSIH